MYNLLFFQLVILNDLSIYMRAHAQGFFGFPFHTHRAHSYVNEFCSYD